MDIQKIDQQKDRCSVVVKGSSPAYMNTIRRLVMTEVPTMAIKSVTFVTNTSAMYDEMIAHRLGLVVLKTDLDGYKIADPKTPVSELGAVHSVDLTLKAEGPCTVYAEMLQSRDPKIKPVFPKTIIAKLTKGQSIDLVAKAVLGKGKTHVKHSPGLLYYYGYPQIKIDPKADTVGAVAICPKKVFKADGKSAVVDKLLACDLCMACSDAYPDAISVDGSEEDFVMFIESWGQLSLNEIISESVKAMDEKLDAFSKSLKSLK